MISASDSASLSDFPDEICLHIFSFFNTQNDVKALGTTCKKLNRISEEASLKEIPYPALDYSQVLSGKSQRLSHVMFGVRAFTVIEETTLAYADLNTISIIDLLTGEFLNQLNINAPEVTSLLKLPNDQLASGHINGEINIWDIKTGRRLYMLKGHLSQISAMTLLEDESLATGDWNGYVKIWNAKNNFEYQQTFFASEKVYRIDTLMDLVIIRTEGSRLIAWNRVTGQKTETKNSLHFMVTSPTECFAFFNNSKVRVNCADRVKKTFDTKLERQLDFKFDQVVALSKGLFAFHCPDLKEIRIWDVANNTGVAAIKVPGKVSQLTVLPTGWLVYLDENDKSRYLKTLAFDVLGSQNKLNKKPKALSPQVQQQERFQKLRRI